MLPKRWLHPVPDLRLRPLLRNPLYGLHEVFDQVLGGAVPVGALLDEVLEQQVVYPADGGEDRVGLLHDLGVGDIPLLDHLRDAPHVSLHALEAPYDLAFVLPLQTPLPLPLIEFFQQLPDHRGVVEGPPGTASPLSTSPWVRRGPAPAATSRAISFGSSA